MMEIKTIYRGAKADNISSEFENNPLLTITPIRIFYHFYTVGYLNKALWSNAATMDLTEAVAFELVYNTLYSANPRYFLSSLFVLWSNR